MAWLTSFPILDALAQKAGVSLVVQEDFLRPDVGVAPRMCSWKRELRQKYEQLRPMCRFDSLHHCAPCPPPLIT